MISLLQPEASLSVVFVTHNSAETIRSAISSVRRHLPEAEIVVVDNGSTDHTREIVSEAAPVQLLWGHGNIGFGAGVNLGVRAAIGDLLLILNPDTTLVYADPRRLRDLGHRSSIGMLGCLFDDKDGARYLQYNEWSWRLELWWDMFQWFLLPQGITIRRPRTKLTRSRLWNSGAAFLIGRREFLDIGGFDEDIFLYFEDNDLSLAATETTALGWARPTLLLLRI